MSVTPERFPPVSRTWPPRCAAPGTSWPTSRSWTSSSASTRRSRERVAETRWHPSQVTETGADGSLVWRARVSGVLEVRSWILGWGGDAEVLEPAELRDWVAAQHAAAAQRYGR